VLTKGIFHLRWRFCTCVDIHMCDLKCLWAWTGVRGMGRGDVHVSPMYRCASLQYHRKEFGSWSLSGWPTLLYSIRLIGDGSPIH